MGLTLWPLKKSIKNSSFPKPWVKLIGGGGELFMSIVEREFNISPDIDILGDLFSFLLLLYISCS